ncbi:polysaccharide biosynthesis tyrosine autokinase [Pusillimonas sp. ANT_WB101]|uniref:polysaccharide biosynthesis tyrosine autokinase n=1 Tax=Pusillimonas sp. ANT_WB101 TaxID=2597356 RepID=UPI0011ED7D27|nr:polysaccharide biosynthesis tyrosine autokinase [Pusillimonas sp. ANT_WB101]KAA0911325.1 polysaccharide biosynthesis tyrosine autokinase [Pusillimonas sp. ANT_WB101]
MTSLSSPAQQSPFENNDIGPLDILNIILEAKWVVLAISAAVVLASIIYVLFSTPIYQANTLIQVENNQGNSSEIMGQMAALFEVQSPASAEMEIIRSRLVVGHAVDELNLYIQAEPNYLPIFGRWLAKRATEMSEPGIFGYGGYVFGNESIEIKTLDLPRKLEGEGLKLIATPEGYRLLDQDGELLAQGKIGDEVKFTVNNEPGLINVTILHAKPRAQFNVRRLPKLKAISDLQERLSISEKGRQSGMIAATLEGIEPAKTAVTLNAIGTAYVAQNIERKAAEAAKTLTFLDEFLPQLSQQMLESEKLYTQFRDQQGTFNLSAEGEMSLRAGAELKANLLELEQKRRELAPRFQQSHPTIKTIERQIAAVREELARIESSTKRMPDLEQKLLSLRRNVQVSSEMYVNLLNSAQQLRLVKEGKVGNVRIVDTATQPEIPIKPKRSLIVGVATIFGLLLGIATALLRNWLHPGIRTPSEIEAALGLHVFATVPHSSNQASLHTRIERKMPGQHVLANSNPHDPAIESLRNLRTSLSFAMLDAKNNVVLLTGPTPGIGKSFTSVNFAAILAAAGKRTLLVDTDMRKGHINQYFGLPRQNGFSEIIAGTVTIDDAIHRDVLTNLDLITTGTLPPNPAELLLSPTATAAINSLASQYDFIILDATPTLAVSDALALAPQAGTTFLLCRADITTLGEIQESVKRIQQTGAKVKGIIFNDLTSSMRRYGSKYDAYHYVDYKYNTQ